MSRRDLSPQQLAAVTRSVHCPSPRAARAGRADIAAFPAVGAVLCTTAERSYPDGSRWLVQLREGTGTSIAALKKLLLRADASPTTRSCAADLILAPPFAFLDASGRTLLPRFPVESCGQPEEAIINAVERHAWTVLSVRRLVEDATRRSTTAHCTLWWKNLFATAPSVRPGNVAPVFGDADDRLRYCGYQSPTGDDPVGGHFEHGAGFDAAESSRLRAALDAARPAPRGCRTQSRFAVVFSGPRYVEVELGGCWRVLAGDTTAALRPAGRRTAVRLLRG